jgi:hypothetical protein
LEEPSETPGIYPRTLGKSSIIAQDFSALELRAPQDFHFGDLREGTAKYLGATVVFLFGAPLKGIRHEFDNMSGKHTNGVPNLPGSHLPERVGFHSQTVTHPAEEVQDNQQQP